MILATSVVADTAPGGRSGKAVRNRTPYHAVPIPRPGDRVRLPTKAMARVPFLGKLKASRSTVVAGLKEYRSVRGRVRQLRSKGAEIRVKPLLKTDSFIVDAIEFRGKGGKANKPKILVVGGVHAGSETVGVESALRFSEGLAKAPSLLKYFDITVVPLVNPSSLMRTEQTRSNFGTPGRFTNGGVDPNRSFSRGAFTKETRAMADLIKTGGYHAVLDLHGAGSHRDGFFIIRGADDGGVASRFTRNADGVALLSKKSAGTTYAYESPGVVTSTNAGTLKQFAVNQGIRYSYTFEAPGSLPAKVQVQGMLQLMHSALRTLQPAE